MYQKKKKENNLVCRRLKRKKNEAGTMNEITCVYRKNCKAI